MSSQFAWRASSYCNNGSCVEVAMLPNGRVAVRDNKDTDGDVMEFSPDEWTTFINRVKA